jgi:hypothetical protein
MMYLLSECVRKVHLFVVVMEASNRSCSATRKETTQLDLMTNILTFSFVAWHFTFRTVLSPYRLLQPSQTPYFL